MGGEEARERYLVQVDGQTLNLCLQPGQKMPVKERITKVIKVLGDRGVYKVGLKVIIMQMKSIGAYTRAGGGASETLRWTDPHNPKDTIGFTINRSGPVRGRKQDLPQPPKKVEVIDLEESEGEEDVSVSLLKGHILGQGWRIPGKSIVPSGKNVQCLYRIPHLRHFNEACKGVKVTYGHHPFRGNQFVIVTPHVPHQQPLIKGEDGRSRGTSVQRPPRPEECGGTKELLRRVEPDPPPLPELRPRTRGRPPLRVREASPAVTRKRVAREVTSSSEEGSSSEESDSTQDDSDFAPPTPPPPIRHPKPQRDSVRHFKCFSKVPPARAVRKGADGRVYFNPRERLSAYDYRDLFENWDKYVRNESNVSGYYKTMLTRNEHTVLVIYHLDKQKGSDSENSPFFTVDKSVELISDGSIKITLEGQDVTRPFHPYLNIRTTNELSSLLQNLMNARVCTGAPGFESVAVYPGARFLNSVWYSDKCTQVRFGSPTDFFANLTTSCGPCTHLRKFLQEEKAAVEGVLGGRAKRGLTNRLRPPIHQEAPLADKPQVRAALTDLIFDLWTEVGLPLVRTEEARGEEPPTEATEATVPSEDAGRIVPEEVVTIPPPSVAAYFPEPPSPPPIFPTFSLMDQV